MLNLRANLRQDITYWALGSDDGYGSTSFTGPTALRGRWEDKIQIVRDSKGDETTSTAQVFFADPVAINAYIAKGISIAADPRTLPDARQIINLSTVPDLANLQQLYVAFL